jgi:hypothetical protein
LKSVFSESSDRYCTSFLCSSFSSVAAVGLPAGACLDLPQGAAACAGFFLSDVPAPAFVGVSAAPALSSAVCLWGVACVSLCGVASLPEEVSGATSTALSAFSRSG